VHNLKEAFVVGARDRQATIASVPLTAIIIRGSQAGTHYGMLDKAVGVDFVWPTAQVTIVGEKVFQHQSLRKEQESGFQLHGRTK